MRTEVMRFVMVFCMLLVVCACGCTSYFEDGVQYDRADIIMTVSHETVFLRYGPDGDGAAECILVMDEDYPGEWRPLLCGEIEGFEHEHGYECTLRVRRSVVRGERGEVVSVEYKLVDVLYMEWVDD